MRLGDVIAPRVTALGGARLRHIVLLHLFPTKAKWCKWSE